MTGCFRLLLVLCLATELVVAPRCVDAAAAAMKGPPVSRSGPPAEAAATADPLKKPMLGAIRFFQEYISPTDGTRCQFAPTCSSFGHQAIRRHGPWLGLLMTTDRLMRCSYLTDPTDYPHLPNGRLADPVTASLGDQ